MTKPGIFRLRAAASAEGADCAGQNAPTALTLSLSTAASTAAAPPMPWPISPSLCGETVILPLPSLTPAATCRLDSKSAARLRWLGIRSEEHTSELQSRFDLVCRLLLEKKK